MRLVVLKIAFVGLLLCQGISSSAATEQESTPQRLDFDPAKIFDQVVSTVAEHFYDLRFDVDAWNRKSSVFRPKACTAQSHDEFDQIMNDLLATLHTSHTYYFSRQNPRRYQLLGVFQDLFDSNDSDLFVYEGIGIRTEQVDGEHLVVAVYDGFPAMHSGLQFGDRIVLVDGEPFHPIKSFKGKSGQQVEIQILRRGLSQVSNPSVVKLDGRTMFEKALVESQVVVERNGKQIGYIHLWSYAGAQYQELLRSSLLWGDLSKCDSLVLDIRDGWGGADPTYLSLFRKPMLEVTSTSRSGKVGSYSGVWGKPVVLLTNGRTTSGKELFTFGFKKLNLGSVVGEKTAGAVVAGRCFLLPNGDALYLAVADVNVDGKRLEGIGVQPSVHVSRELQFPVDGDPQLEVALRTLETED